MANMGKVTKAKINLRVDLHLCRAVEAKYSFESDKAKSDAYIRALETIIFCLSGASTRGANRARKQNGRVSFFGHGVEAPTNER